MGDHSWVTDEPRTLNLERGPKEHGLRDYGIRGRKTEDGGRKTEGDKAVSGDEEGRAKGIAEYAEYAEGEGRRREDGRLNTEDGGRRTEGGGQSSVVSHQSSVDGSLHHAGYGAKAAVFSFNGNKIMTTSGGGMLASHDERLIEHARKLSQQARDPAPHYEHSEIGYTYRMSNILAAIGRGQLRVLDERVAAKRRIFEQYRHLLADLPGITFMPEPPYGRCNR